MPAPYALLGADGPVSGEDNTYKQAEEIERVKSSQLLAKPPKPAWKRCSRRIVSSTFFKILSLSALVIALFGGGLVTILDLPDDPTNIFLDSIMTAVMFFFVVELLLRSASERDYPWSFFFWMDVLGTLSMVFEISFLCGSAGKIYKTDSGPNAAVVRTARAARIGARAGRLSKPLRIMSLLFRRPSEEDKQEAGYTAKVLGNRLTQVFSSKVAMLTVVLTLGVPLFQIGRYPEDDFSMRSWGYKLEADFSRDYHALESQGEAPGFFAASVKDMRFFYGGGLHYFPFQLDGYPESLEINGLTFSIPADEVVDDVPVRLSNIVMLQVDDCLVPRQGCGNGEKAAIYFDFRDANQYSAGMDMAVVVFIIVCMCLESCDLSFSINSMMVKPMERMLDSAHLMAKQLNQAMAKARGRRIEVADNSKEMENLARRMQQNADGGDDDEDDDDHDDTMNEIELLQGVFKKVVFLLSIFMEDTSNEEMNQLDVESKGVLQDVVLTNSPDLDEGRRSFGGTNSMSRPDITICTNKRKKSSKITRSASKSSCPRPTVAGADVALPFAQVESFEAWDFNMIETEPNHRQKILKHIMFATPVGDVIVNWLEPDCYTLWSEAVKAKYNDTPFTNYSHACDVTVVCHRILNEIQWTSWLGDLEAAVLLLSAQGHDIGHPGHTNLFLVETRDELALRYNDKSPLENMHCATLFEVCKDEKANIFKNLDTASYRVARTLCIDSILYTDNAMHFELVKEIKKVYGTSSDICDVQAKKGLEFDAEYINQVLAPNSALWLKTILHLSDISNPLTAFSTAQVWANCVMEEFFRQGDQEKKLGVPIGILNDREKVSIPSAQHGFINVLLHPLLISTMRVFYTLSPLASQMATNLQEWHKLWLNDSPQRAEDVTKHEEQIKKILDQVAELKTPVGLTLRENTQALGQVNFAGHWTCVATWGLEDFLSASGVSYVRRKAASSAPWPAWEFQQSGDNIVFLNHSALGRLREEYTVDGRPYTCLDGWKQKVQIIAVWENHALVVNKEGPQGKFREERRIDESGRLQFTLFPLKDELRHLKWGRTFERSRKKE